MMRIEKIRAWCEELEAGLSQTFAGDRDAIVEGVNGGWLEAYRLWGGEAYMVTRVERGVLTCCCYQGARVREAMRWMRAQCLRLGLSSIVFFTARPGLARLLGEFSPQLEQSVYRVKVA
jgi:hypothetical protein